MEKTLCTFSAWSEALKKPEETSWVVLNLFMFDWLTEQGETGLVNLELHTSSAMPIFPLGQAGTFQRQGCPLDIRQVLCDLCQDEVSLCGEIKCPTSCIWKSIRGECSDVMTKPKLSCFSLGWLTLCLLQAVWMKKNYLGQLTQSVFSPWSFPILSWSETKDFAISAELPTMREKVSLFDWTWWDSCVPHRRPTDSTAL